MNLLEAYEIVAEHMTDFLDENFDQKAFPDEASRIRKALLRIRLAAGEELLPLQPEERNDIETSIDFLSV